MLLLGRRGSTRCSALEGCFIRFKGIFDRGVLSGHCRHYGRIDAGYACQFTAGRAAVLYSVAGTRYWLGSQWNYSGKIIQSLMQGDAEHPFGSVLWTKSTCNLDPATTYCVNGPNAAFTRLNPVDVRSLWFVGLYQPQPNDGGLLAIIHEENAGAAPPQSHWARMVIGQWEYVELPRSHH